MGRDVPISVASDSCVVLGHFAGALAEGAPLAKALEFLREGFCLRTVVVRGVTGDVLGVAGEVLHAVPRMRSVSLGSSSIELPVLGRTGTRMATVTVVGARPSQLPALRAAAAVVALVLSPTIGVEELLDAAEQDRHDLADSLHDGPVQDLVVARYALDAALQGGDVTVARDAVQSSLVQVRRSLWHLRPRGADGLVAALHALSAQLDEAGGRPLVLRGDLEAAGELPRTLAAVAYRLTQAVSRGAVVLVTLRREAAVLVIDLSGGTPLAHPERWAARARALGGDLSASAGRLRLALPLRLPNTDARTPS